MLYIITPVKTEIEAKNLQVSLEKNYNSLGNGVSILIITNNQNIYLELKRITELLYNENPAIQTLVVFNKKANFESAKRYINGKATDKCILLNNKIQLTRNAIQKMLATDSFHINSGIITGKLLDSKLNFKVNDIYNPTKKEQVNEREVVEIDICPLYCMLCKLSAYMAFNFNTRKNFSLELRKIGYMNYLNNDILYVNGDSNGTANNCNA